MSRNWNAQKVPGGIAIGDERRTVMINPDQRGCYTNPYHRESGAYVLHFGAYGWTRVHVYASGLDKAVEEAAAYLAEYEPGHIMAHGSDQHTALCREAFAAADLVWTGEIDWNDPRQEAAIRSAEADLTYTESGYLTAYEWGLALERPTSAQLYAYVKGQ